MSAVRLRVVPAAGGRGAHLSIEGTGSVWGSGLHGAAELLAPEIDDLIRQLGKARDEIRRLNTPKSGWGTYR